MEFKGTKGKWYKPQGSTVVISEKGNSICDYAGLDTTEGEDEANALLISKAPEMLKFIQHVYNTMPNGSSLQSKAKELIKEATTL